MKVSKHLALACLVVREQSGLSQRKFERVAGLGSGMYLEATGVDAYLIAKQMAQGEPNCVSLRTTN